MSSAAAKTAYRDCSCLGVRAVIHRLRRAHLGTRRVHSSADNEPVAGAAGKAGLTYLFIATTFRGAAHQQPGRHHVPRHIVEITDRKELYENPFTPYQGVALAVPIRTRCRKETRKVVLKATSQPDEPSLSGVRSSPCRLAMTNVASSAATSDSHRDHEVLHQNLAGCRKDANTLKLRASDSTARIRAGDTPPGRLSVELDDLSPPFQSDSRSGVLVNPDVLDHRPPQYNGLSGRYCLSACGNVVPYFLYAIRDPIHRISSDRPDAACEDDVVRPE